MPIQRRVVQENQERFFTELEGRFLKTFAISPPFVKVYNTDDVGFHLPITESNIWFFDLQNGNYVSENVLNNPDTYEKYVFQLQNPKLTKIFLERHRHPMSDHVMSNAHVHQIANGQIIPGMNHPQHMTNPGTHNGLQMVNGAHIPGNSSMHMPMQLEQHAPKEWTELQMQNKILHRDLAIAKDHLLKANEHVIHLQYQIQEREKKIHEFYGKFQIGENKNHLLEQQISSLKEEIRVLKQEKEQIVSSSLKSVENIEDNSGLYMSTPVVVQQLHDNHQVSSPLPSISENSPEHQSERRRRKRKGGKTLTRNEPKHQS